MELKAQKMNVGNMVYATEIAKSRVNDWLSLAEKIKNDSDKAARKQAQECVSCFYCVGRIGGSAMTTRPCMACGNDQMYGSTCTDVLCMECAKKHNLCKHCGGDVDMKVRRKAWPVSDELNKAG